MRRVVVSGIISNSLEWYSYALYGYFSAIIGKLFFPLTDPNSAMIASFAVFAAGFLMRPVGAILFGLIGDKYGRKTALSGSVLLMAIPTALIGTLPSYEIIGIWAPILLTFCRLLQGLALGGAFSGSMTFVIEHAKPKYRGFIGSTTMLSMILGMLFGAVSAYLIALLLTEEAFNNWGWRLAFLAGLPAGIAGLYIRQLVPESPEYLAASKESRLTTKPIKELFSKHKKPMLLVIGICLSLTVPFYTLTVFMNSFLITIANYSERSAMLMNSLNMLVLLITIPASALLSDKIGKKPILLTVVIAYLIFTYPIFVMLVNGGQILQAAAQILFAILVGSFIGPIPALMVSMFPVKVRYTGVSTAYNLSIGLFGGTAPMVITWLAQLTGINIMVALYVMFFAMISLVALLFYKE